MSPRKLLYNMIPLFIIVTILDLDYGYYYYCVAMTTGLPLSKTLLTSQ